MRPLRILAVGNMYPPHHQGGYELVWQAAMGEARGRGHSVRILTSTHRDPAVTTADEPDVHRALRWYWDWHRHEFGRLAPAARARLEKHNQRVLNTHLAEFRPDVVTWWSMGHMSLSLIEQVRRIGLPAVFSIHNDWLVYAWRADQWTRLWHARPRLLRAAAERVLRLPTQVALTNAGPLLFNSRYTLARAQAAGIDVSAATVIHPGIDTAYLDPVPPADWAWRLLYVGRLDRFKGVDTALRALADLPDNGRLAIHGKGDPHYERELRGLADTLGITDRVTFGPFATRDELRAIYAQADAVVFPVRGEEPWGLVPLEAMGLGRPVVSTARGGTAEFVHDGHNALVIEPDDPTALAAAVIRLADNPTLRRRLTGGGAETAARHTAVRFNSETVDAIEAAARLRAAEPELVAVPV